MPEQYSIAEVRDRPLLQHPTIRAGGIIRTYFYKPMMTVRSLSTNRQRSPAI